MSEETTTATPPVEPVEPVDDATIVNPDPVVAEEKAHEELVAAVAKKLDTAQKEQKEQKEQPEQSEEPGEKPENTAKTKDGEGENEKPEKEDASLSEVLQSRAKEAGLTDDLAQRLHESGQLEETIAAFDRGLIERFQSKEEDEPKAKEEKEPKEPPKDQPDQPDEDATLLDPDVYGEDLVKRDAYQQKRIDALEAQLAEFRGQFQDLVEQQQGGFDEWFDGTLTDLGLDTSDNDKCQAVFKAYGAMCDAFGKNYNDRDKAMVERAYAAMYPQDVFKQKQRQTVDRLRDAQGKFLSSSNSKGGPPPKGATDEEVHEQLVSNVTALLKERGVQMSGV